MGGKNGGKVTCSYKNATVYKVCLSSHVILLLCANSHACAHIVLSSDDCLVSLTTLAHLRDTEYVGVVSHRAILTCEHAESGHFELEIENREVASGTASAVAISCFSGELHFD